MGRRTPNSTAFGAAVSNVLAERQMSQFDLAQAVGKSPAYTNQTMTGRKHASPEWVNLVAETLNLSAKERVALHRRGS
jgi:cyanate lyase